MKVRLACAPSLLSVALLALTSVAMAQPRTYNCKPRRKFLDPEGIKKCLPRLDMDPDLFEPCKSQLCFIFLRQDPFVRLDNVRHGDDRLVFNATDTIEDQSKSQTPFKCSDPDSAFPGLEGIAFDLLKRVGGDALCMWGGDTCTFNNLVQYTRKKSGDGYQFGITGLLLETEERQCFHEASTPILDETLLIIGRNTPDDPLFRGTLSQLHGPFEPRTWLVFGSTAIAFLVVSVATAVFVSRDGGTFCSGIMAVFTGDHNEAVMSENEQDESQLLRMEPSSRENPAIVTFRMSRTFFAFAVLAFFGIFALFYELAAVRTHQISYLFCFSTSCEIRNGQTLTSLSFQFSFIPLLRIYRSTFCFKSSVVPSTNLSGGSA